MEQILASNDDENLIDAAEEIVTYVDIIKEALSELALIKA